VQYSTGQYRTVQDSTVQYYERKKQDNNRTNGKINNERQQQQQQPGTPAIDVRRWLPRHGGG
jgi:hypothetical protein